MSVRRVLGAAGAALAVLLLAATPASAAEPTVTWTDPPEEGRVLRAPGAIKGTITTDQDTQKITVVGFELDQDALDERDPCFVDVGEAWQIPKDQQKSTVDLELDLQFPCNRKYELRAIVTYEDPLVGSVGLPPKTELAQPPLQFGVAIPPAQVTGVKATHDPASKQVQLSWDPNTEVDLIGYRVERNAPGRGGFEVVATPGRDETGFVDNNIDVKHGYRVSAVREGPDGPIVGRSSLVASAGPEPPPPSLPKVESGTRRATGPGSIGEGNRPKVRRRTATTVDTGFSQDLPFDPSQTTSSLPVPSTGPDGQAAVLAEFDDDEGDRRATLVPIAGGLALLMSAVHVRLLSKRIGDDDIPILPGS